MKAKYCKIKNTYTIEQCDKCKCDFEKAQGIGSLSGGSISIKNP
jgi:hypothetical protein